MAWTKGQITKIAYNAKGATKNPTMNRYLPCCMVTDPDRIADATAGDAWTRAATGACSA
ncbi:hypothetical protein GCM10010317_099750 [Streptomyces mirabilis]|nr:hypothetical protein GCM10010317_099750 [Streptomyces mirabilis]